MSIIHDLGQSGRSSEPASSFRLSRLLSEAVSARLHNLARARQARSAARELHELSDRDLKDIGLTRSEIDFVVKGKRGLPLPPGSRIGDGG